MKDIPCDDIYIKSIKLFCVLEDMMKNISRNKLVIVVCIIALIVLNIFSGNMTIETPMWITVCALVVLDEKFTEEEYLKKSIYKDMDLFIVSIPVGVLAGLIVADRMKMLHLENWMGILAIIISVALLAAKKYVIKKIR